MKPLFPSRDPATLRLARSLATLAATDVPLLLEGETGTGKSWVARRIHLRGRPRLPLLEVDCGAVPEGLFPAEMFGHVAGAFTDATRSRAGALARAGAGTVVLDRVDVLPAGAQVSVLRALDERRFVPLGGTTAVALRARVVAIVGPGVREAVASGALRADLYHRLAGFHAVLPPLRERPADILPFARAFLRRQGRRGRQLRLTADAEEVLMEVLMDLEEHRRERRVRVESGDHLPAVKVDGVKLRQVFFNLIANAIRHMGECEDPCVRVSAETQGDKAVFCVRDNGIGIPPDLQEKIFEPFRHYSVSGSPGLGIGLSTVKRAVTAWGGRVWVESRPGEGAAFFFTAPLA